MKPEGDIPFTSSAPAGEEFEGRTVETKKTPSVLPKDRMETALMTSSVWGPEPCLVDQEFLYPDSVRVAGMEVHTLMMADDGDKKRLASLFLSNERRGGSILMREPEFRWLEQSENWKVLLVIKKREFKQIES